VRLIAAAITLAAGLVVLWQAGLLSESSGEVRTPDITLSPANVDLTTAGASGFSVGLKEGNLAPDFEFSSFEGERMRLSELRGRPVLLNFWATWCGPCRVELPDMQDLLRRHEGQNFAIVAMNNGESFKSADRFLKKLEVRLTAFGYDPQQDVARRYAVQGLPTSYFIDSRGIIVKVVAGQLTKTLMESGARAALDGYKVY
jgi:thiol-disulfide isomerase/thioredoxin